MQYRCWNLPLPNESVAVALQERAKMTGLLVGKSLLPLPSSTRHESHTAFDASVDLPGANLLVHQ